MTSEGVYYTMFTSGPYIGGRSWNVKLRRVFVLSVLLSKSFIGASTKGGCMVVCGNDKRSFAGGETVDVVRGDGICEKGLIFCFVLSVSTTSLLGSTHTLTCALRPPSFPSTLAQDNPFHMSQTSTYHHYECGVTLT